MRQRYILFSFLSGFLTSCICSDPSYLVDGSTFAFRIVDETTGEVVFPNRFNPWAFEIISDEGDTVDIDSRRNNTNPDFIINPTGGQRFRYDERERRRYFLHFDSTDIDTLALFYVPREDDCDEYLDDFEAYYNDELVFTGSGKRNYGANIPKL